MRYIAIVCCFCLFLSCDLFKIHKKEPSTKEIVAIVNTEKLFKTDFIDVLPKNIHKIDSQVLAKSYIQDWAINKLLLEKAKNNSSSQTMSQINDLVKGYKESLLINNYKEQLVKQKLDTVISEEELNEFYSSNKENFKLNKELIKIKFLHVDTNIKDKNKILALFKSDDIFDLDELEKQELSFKFHQFNDSIWRELDNVLLKLPFSKEKLLKKKLIGKLRIFFYFNKFIAVDLFILIADIKVKKNPPKGGFNIITIFKKISQLTNLFYRSLLQC